MSHYSREILASPSSCTAGGIDPLKQIAYGSRSKRKRGIPSLLPAHVCKVQYVVRNWRGMFSHNWIFQRLVRSFELLSRQFEDLEVLVEWKIAQFGQMKSSRQVSVSICIPCNADRFDVGYPYLDRIETATFFLFSILCSSKPL